MTAAAVDDTARRPAIPVRVRLRAALFLSPSLPLLLVAIAMFVWFAADEAGFLGTTFLPGTLLVLGLLVLGLAVLPRPRPSRAVLVAIASLTAYALWSYLSMLWADQQAIAWDGANRTLLYALLFALFALWPLRGGPAAVLLGLFGIAVAVIAGVELLRASAAPQWIDYFHEGRLQEPAGYVNANVALWFSAFWPCVLLAPRREVPPAITGLLMAGAGVLASMALLGQSRGWLFALPVTVLLAVAVVPGRGRTIVALAGVGVAMLLILRPLLDVYEAFSPRGAPGEALSHAVRLTFVVSAALGALSYLAAVADARVHVSAQAARRTTAALVAAFALACVGGVGVYTVVKGNPVSRGADAWREFKRGGYEPSNQSTRLGTTFVTHRYDYWRVAWQSFERHPVAGVGVDNYAQDYMRRGKTIQTPVYPHSFELRALSETGLVGALLLAAAIAAAVYAALPALRRADFAGATAGAGLIVFAYWVVHGSQDWLWEFAGLGGPAFAALGLAGAVAEGRRGPLPSLRPLVPGWRGIGLAAAIAIPAIVAVGLPWLAERQLREGRDIARKDPFAALRRFDRSASLNPLSALPDSTAGVIDLRIGRQGPAQSRFREALERDPGDPFPYLQLGAIASTEGRRAEALRLVERAHRLSPRDAVIAEALRIIRAGKTLSPERVNELFLRDIDRRIGPG